MKKFYGNAAKKANALKMQACKFLAGKRGETSVSIAVTILISVVLGALILTGLYALMKNQVLPDLAKKITDMFNYAG